VFYFHNGGAEDVYLSSADWMDRNFFRRVETCFPVLDAKLKRRVINEGLKSYLDDNCQAWDMDQEGRYELRQPRRGKPHAAQDTLLEMLARAQLPA
jgi:polyphosphate kinase